MNTAKIEFRICHSVTLYTRFFPQISLQKAWITVVIKLIK